MSPVICLAADVGGGAVRLRRLQMHAHTHACACGAARGCTPALQALAFAAPVSCNAVCVCPLECRLRLWLNLTQLKKQHIASNALLPAYLLQISSLGLVVCALAAAVRPAPAKPLHVRRAGFFQRPDSKLQLRKSDTWFAFC